MSYTPILVGSASTTDATPTTLITIPTITGSNYMISVDVVCKLSTGESKCFRKVALFKNVSGTLSIETGSAVLDVFTAIANAALTTATSTITTSGTNILIQVTGIAATTISWKAQVTSLQL